MDAAELIEHCLAKPGSWLDNPFHEEHPVVKVGDKPYAGKIFAFVNTDTVGVKAGTDREMADEWLDRYPGEATVMAYIGRSGWNSLVLTGSIPDDEILEAVDESYVLVVSKLARKHRPTGWEQ